MQHHALWICARALLTIYLPLSELYAAAKIAVYFTAHQLIALFVAGNTFIFLIYCITLLLLRATRDISDFIIVRYK